jgi:hypothetical protein
MSIDSADGTRLDKRGIASGNKGEEAIAVGCLFTENEGAKVGIPSDLSTRQIIMDPRIQTKEEAR